MITINNRKYSGKNISINNDSIKIDQIDITSELGNTINIININGNIQSLNVQSSDINIKNGSVKYIKSNSGDIRILGDIIGNVNTISGDVEVNGSIKGDVTTKSGNIYKR